MNFVMSEVPKDKTRGWKVLVDGVAQEGVGMVELVSERHGRVVYGLRPEGYDAWVYYEPGGGGGATIPFSRTPDGELLVALIREVRSNMGDEPVFDLIGGFVDPGETHAQAHDRELREETGLDAANAVELRGAPANSNRAFWVTDPDKDEGLHVRGLSIPFTMLEEDGVGFRFKSGHDIDIKKAENVRFFPWREAVRLTPDALARSAIAQLLAELL